MSKSWSTFKSKNSWNSLQDKPAILADNQITWDEIQNKPLLLPDTGTLDLNFVSGETLDNRITFTRNSIATRINSFGVLETVTANTPRFDYDPVTLLPRGLLIEEQRTNSIRNNTMVGAVAGTPGTVPTNWVITGSVNGLTRGIVGTGTDNGIAYIDVKVSGTPSATSDFYIGFEPTTGVAGLTAQTWTNTAFVKVVAGSLTNIGFVKLNIVERDAAGSGTAVLSNESANLTIATSGSFATCRQRYTVTTSGGGTTAFVQPRVIFRYTSGLAIDITLRIGLPQLEQGAFATSVIPTTTTALTRGADVASMTGTNFSSWYNQTQGTFFADATSNATSGNRPILTAQIAGGHDRHQMAVYAPVATTVNASVVQAIIGTNLTSPIKAAYAYATNDFAVSVSGAAVVTDTSGTVPTTLTYATFGKFDFGGGESINGYIRRIRYYPKRLSNQALQILTR